MKRLLGVCLIVKDEAKTIGKTIASVIGYVDAITVIDTGSTDGTQDILRRVASPEVVLVEEPFSDYAAMRNRVMEVAAERNPTEFTLALSADETLVGGEHLRQYLASEGASHDALFIMMHADKRQWPFPRVLRTGGGWRWKNTAGKRHEQPFGPNGENEAPLIPGVHVVHEESDPERKLIRLRERDLPDLRAEVADESKNPLERAEAMFQLAETLFILGHNAPRDKGGQRALGGEWLSQLFEAMSLYVRYAELMEEQNPHRAMYARCMFCYVGETFGLFEPSELIKRLHAVAAAAPMLPEAHWLLAKNAAKVYAEPVHGAVDVTLEWQSYLLGAACAEAVKDKRLQHSMAKQALAAGAPMEQVESLLPPEARQ